METGSPDPERISGSQNQKFRIKIHNTNVSTGLSANLWSINAEHDRDQQSSVHKIIMCHPRLRHSWNVCEEYL